MAEIGTSDASGLILLSLPPPRDRYSLSSNRNISSGMDRWYAPASCHSTSARRCSTWERRQQGQPGWAFGRSAAAGVPWHAVTWSH